MEQDQRLREALGKALRNKPLLSPFKTVFLALLITLAVLAVALYLSLSYLSAL